MIRLKNRQMQIPFGFKYYLPQTKWKAHEGTFDSIVTQLQQHLAGNPLVASQIKVDPKNVEQVRVLVDFYNAKLCEANKWTDYYLNDTGQTPPKGVPPSATPALRSPGWSAQGAVAAGANTLRDWFGAGGKPVAVELARSRAERCAQCPKNDVNSGEGYAGDWTRYFTKPAADFLKKQFEKRAEMKLATEFDDKIDVCQACLCPLKLKVWCPMEHIKARMPEAVKAELDTECWVLKES